MFNLNEANPLSMLRQFSDHLQGEIVEHSNSYVLKVENGSANGYIKLFEIYQGVSAWVYNIKFAADLSIDMSFSENPIYYFGYNLEGYQLQRFHSSDEYREIRQGQNFILKSHSDNKTNLVIPKDVKYKCCYVIIDPKILEKNPTKSKQSLQKNLEKLVSQIDINSTYAYYGNIDPATGVYARLILDYKSSDLIGQLFAEAAVHNMLANQLRAFKSDQNEKHVLYPNRLNELELLKILELSEYLKDNIERKVSIKELSNYSGLSPKKIQDGSRFLYGVTINNFANRIRLEQAKKLLSDKSLTVSEICYRCGYTSRSYFSKIFHDRFDMRPIDYRDSLNSKEMIYELSYQSSALVDTRVQIESIVSTAKRMNEKFGITGCLIYTGKRFFQIIEGSRSALSQLYKNLLNDSRHKDLVIMWKGYKPEREFPNFSMAFIHEDHSLMIENKEFEFMALDQVFNQDIDEEIISERLWFKIKSLLEIA